MVGKPSVSVQPGRLSKTWSLMLRPSADLKERVTSLLAPANATPIDSVTSDRVFPMTVDVWIAVGASALAVPAIVRLL